MLSWPFSKNGAFNIILGLGVRLVDGKYPEVWTDNKNWSPICGHFFWDNNYGATLFCKQLGFNNGRYSKYLLADSPCPKHFQTLVFNLGIVSKVPGKPLAKDAIRVGRCNSNDEWLGCKGGCNDLGIGNGCAQCSAGSKASVEIKCDPGKHNTKF